MPFQEISSPSLRKLFVQQLEGLILSGELRPGDRLPTEAQLARENGISVITVRKAIDGLVRKGLLECKQGKGTFVSHHKLQQNMKKLQKKMGRMGGLGGMGGGFPGLGF